MAERLEPRALMAVAGSLDPTFGASGYASIPTQTGLPVGIFSLSIVAVEKDGSVVASGQTTNQKGATFGVIHLTAGGALDTSFGIGGEADVAQPSGGNVINHPPETLLVQADGKIIVGGILGLSTTSTLRESIVARFNANGTPDTTFGTNGVFTIKSTDTALGGALVQVGAIQHDGKIVLTGFVPTPGGMTGSTEAAAIRLNTNGTLDTSFGSAGLVTLTTQTPAQMTSVFVTSEAGEGVAIQPDGKIVVSVALVGPPEGASFQATLTPELFRINANGSRDTTLSQTGLQSSELQSPNFNGLVVQPDGKILVLGAQFFRFSSGPVLARLNADGTLNKATSLPSPFGIISPTGLALQSNGDVVISITPNSVSNLFAVLRLTPNLSPDLTFGAAGLSRLAIAPSSTTIINSGTNAIAVAPDGKIVLAGFSNTRTLGTTNTVQNLVVARITTTGSAQPGDYTGDGIADPTIYLPTLGDFAIRSSSGGPDQILPFGIPGAGQTIPVAANFDGSNRQELAVYLPSLGAFAYRPTSGGPDQIITFGIAGKGQTIPAPGDYFGTGQTDIAAYLPSLGDFALRNPLGGPDQIIPFGIAGAGQTIPAPGDYDGSGRTELAVYLPTLGAFAYRPASGGADVFVRFGIAGQGQTIPDPGDYDGSGHTELAVYLPSLGEFIYRPANGGADVVIHFGIPGTGQSIPAPGDYSGAGITEPAVYLASYGSFAYRPFSAQSGIPVPTGGPDVIEAFGVPGPGQTIPVTVVDVALATGGGSVSAASVDLIDFVPEPAGKKGRAGTFSSIVGA